MSDFLLAKRKRTEDPNVDDEPQPIPSRSEIWYDDGSVVMQANSTQFRVHQSILSAHSPVLKDMLLLAPSDERLVEGCPVLHLSDSEEDMAHLLKTLYDRRYYHPSDCQPFVVVAAILRLSQKYQIDYLRDDAISRLTFEYPSTLEGRDAFHTNPRGRVGLVCGRHVDVINLARETGIHSILPYAFLLVASQTKGILEGMRRDDGTLAVLSRADQELCLLANNRVRAAHANDMFGWLHEESMPSPYCRTPRRCFKARKGHMVRLWQPPSPAPDLMAWEARDWKKGLCVLCVDIGKKSYDEGRQLLWNKLPSFFGLPGWAELL